MLHLLFQVQAGSESPLTIPASLRFENGNPLSKSAHLPGLSSFLPPTHLHLTSLLISCLSPSSQIQAPWVQLLSTAENKAGGGGVPMSLYLLWTHSYRHNSKTEVTNCHFRA